MTHPFIPRYLLKKNENPSSHKNLYMNVCSHSIYRYQKPQTRQMLISWQTDEQIVVYPYNGIPLCNNNKSELVTQETTRMTLKCFMLCDWSQLKKLIAVCFFLIINSCFTGIYKTKNQINGGKK